jgi:hypothetical protein
MDSKTMISHVEAINVVGKALFADNWIGEMLFRDKEVIFPGIATDERTLIEEYGPRAAVRGGITIKPCPSATLQAKLERALGRQQLIPAQRGAAADWLFDHGLAHADGCDSTAIASAISGPSTRDVAKIDIGKARSAIHRIAPPELMARKDAVRACIERGMIPGKTTPWALFCVKVRDLANGWIDKHKGTIKRRFDDKTIERDVKEIINSV